MSRLRVGLVSPYDLSVPGGVQAQVLGLARYLGAHGDEALVIGPGLPDEVVGVDLGSSVAIPGNGSKVPISVDPAARRLIKEAVARLDLLHVHEPLMPMASLFATHAGLPVVATFHAAPGRAGRLLYRLPRPILRRLLGSTVAVTAVSATAASVLPDDVEVEIIPNGLDLASMRIGAERSEHMVAFLGRDEPRKGLDVLLAAWPRVLAAEPGARLTVMGSNRGLEGITWKGWVDDRTKAEILGSAAVYVAPQLGGESFGIVLLEAMAAGAAVVASSLDAFVAVAAGAARYFPVGDSNALAEAIVHLLRNRGERQRLADAGATVADRYDWSRVGPAYREVYAGVATQVIGS
jgi:phosphatidylinositol alpha-mannosyltransferase